MAIGKGLKIGIVLIAIIGVIVPITAVTVINMENARIAAWNELLDSDDRVVNITVDGVLVGNVSYNRIVQGIAGKQNDVNLTQVNSVNTRSTTNYTGVPLWNVIKYSNVDYGSCNGVRFWSTDIFTSMFIGLDEIQAKPDQFLVCWEKGNVNTTLTPLGPLIIATNFSVIQPKPNGNYNAKLLGSINFVHAYNYNLTIFGEGILSKNVTIPFGLTNTTSNNQLYKTTKTFNYTDSVTSWTDSYYGTPIGGYLLNRTTGLAYDDSWADWASFRFVSDDGTTSPWMDKTDAINNPNLYMIVWQRGGVDLGFTDGLFMGVCNYSVYQSTYPQGSDHFFIPNLVGIELSAIA
jgi:hypothetical protein